MLTTPIIVLFNYFHPVITVYTTTITNKALQNQMTNLAQQIQLILANQVTKDHFDSEMKRMDERTNNALDERFINIETR